MGVWGVSVSSGGVRVEVMMWMPEPVEVAWRMRQAVGWARLAISARWSVEKGTVGSASGGEGAGRMRQGVGWARLAISARWSVEKGTVGSASRVEMTVKPLLARMGRRRAA